MKTKKFLQVNMQPFPPSEEREWIDQIRRKELARSAAALSKLSKKIQLSDDYVTNTPSILANIISIIADILSDKIPSDVPASQLDQVSTFLGVITSHLRYAERAKVTQTPWSIVQPTEKFLKLVTDENSQFIIRPTWSYNYSLVGDFWASYRDFLLKCRWFPIDELRSRFSTFSDNQKIYCLSFPRIERSNSLLHANWGHEVGHILAKAWIDKSFNNAWAKYEPEIKKNIKEFVQKNPPPLVDPLFKDVIINQIAAEHMTATLNVAQQGLIELLCDRVGVYLFGPSALAAATEFTTRFALDISPLQAGFYPPWRYRIREMVDFCNIDLDEKPGTGYPNKTLKPFIDWLLIGRRLSTSTTDIDIINANIVTAEAYKLMGRLWSTASEEITQMLPKELSDPYRLHERFKIVTELVSRIDAGIPPNEFSNSVDGIASLQDILCSAWAYKYKQINSDPTWGDHDDANRLFKLVLKACESSYVSSEWGPRLREMDAQ
jgi:hypothetical protein